MQPKWKVFAGFICLSVASISIAPSAGAEVVEGTLHWYKRVELGPAVSGVVSEVKVNPGDRVRRGEELVRLDRSVFEARVQHAKARVGSEEEAYAEARREMERAQELYDRTVLSQHDLQMATNAHVRARAELEQAKAELVKAQTDLQYSSVSAPFNGIVLERLAEPGKVISSELTPMTLIVLAEADHMLARGQLSEAQLRNLSVGQSVEVRRQGGEQFAGKIHVIGLEPVDQTSPLNYPVDVLFATRGQTLRVGEAVELVLP